MTTEATTASQPPTPKAQMQKYANRHLLIQTSAVVVTEFYFLLFLAPLCWPSRQTLKSTNSRRSRQAEEEEEEEEHEMSHVGGERCDARRRP